MVFTGDAGPLNIGAYPGDWASYLLCIRGWVRALLGLCALLSRTRSVRRVDRAAGKLCVAVSMSRHKPDRVAECRLKVLHPC